MDVDNRSRIPLKKIHMYVGSIVTIDPDRLLMSVMENSSLLFSCGHLQLAIFR